MVAPLKEAELLEVCQQLHDLIYEEGFRANGRPSAINELAKRRGQAPSTISKYISFAKQRGLIETVETRRGSAEQVGKPVSRVAELEGKVKRLETENRSLRSESADVAELNKLIHGALRANPKPPRWLLSERAKLGKRWEHGTPTLFLSDLHLAEKVYSNQVNGVNEFDLEIAKRRLQRVVDTTCVILFDVLSRPDYPGLVCPLGGDILSGNIHEELRESNEVPILESVLVSRDYLVAAIDALRDQFPALFIPCVVGNHGRLDKKPRMKWGVQDNLEWLVYHLLARHYAKDPRVTIAVSESFDYHYRVYGHGYLLTHGDSMKGGSGISGFATPWALGDFRRRKRQGAIDAPYDTMIFGHFHTLAWGPADSYIANGSLKGYDEFAFKKGFGYEPPQQALWLTHPQYGIHSRWGIYGDELEGAHGQGDSWVSIPAPEKKAA